MQAEVALETTVMTHGLPPPVNLQAMRDMIAEIRAAGALPRPVGILNGRPSTCLSDGDLAGLAAAAAIRKCALRDLPVIAHTREHGGTTVSATLHLALRDGIQVFATGGIGGVHRGADGDVSADLPALASIPGTVVCSGAKSILDLPKTRERLETDGVPVIGYRTDVFPAFTGRESGLPVDQRVETPEDVADIIRHRDALGLRSAVLVCVPCPEDTAISAAENETALADALAAAEAANIRGKALTPFLLTRMAEHTEGRSLRANLSLLKQNARVAADIAMALTR